MGITKRAVTIYGLQVPMDKIVDEHVEIASACICIPKTGPQLADAKFCPKCGRSVSYKRQTTSIKENIGIEGNEEDFNLTIACYPTSGMIREDKYMYVGIVVSETDAAYSAEGSDPVLYDMPLITDMDVVRFRESMQKYDLWDPLKFGLWTVLLLG